MNFVNFYVLKVLGFIRQDTEFICRKIKAKRGKVKHEFRVTSSNPRVTNSNPRVTSSNPRVTSSNPRVTSSNSRVTVQIHELED